MATTYTQEQLDALNAAIASGALVVEYGDKRVEYRSLNDMIRTRNLMLQDLTPPANRKSGRKYASFTKGLK